MWPSLGWGWDRAVGREDKGEMLSPSPLGFLVPNHVFRARAWGPFCKHSEHTQLHQLLQKKNTQTLSQMKGWVNIHRFFRHVIYTDFQVTASYGCSTFANPSVGGVNILEFCCSWRVSSAKVKPGKEKLRNRIYPLSKLGA